MQGCGGQGKAERGFEDERADVPARAWHRKAFDEFVDGTRQVPQEEAKCSG